MATFGLLEQLYTGGLEPGYRLPDPAVDPAKERRVDRLLAEYRELIKDYPPRELERLGEPPAALWKGLKELGLFGMLIAEEYGGLGLSLTQYLRVVEQLSQDDLALALIPLAHLSIGVKGILLFGSDEQKRRYLPKAASGEMIFAFALTEPRVGSDAQHIETRAELANDGSSYLLTGQKTYITNANYAGGMTVFAQLDPQRPGSMGAFIVETGWEGVKIGKDMPKMGLAISSTAAVQLKGVRVPVENLLGRPGDGFKIAMTILNYGRLGLGAGAHGGMRRSVSDMVARAGSRIQFGSPIAKFDLVQEKIARTWAMGFAVGAMTELTARILESDPLANVAIESSHCKLFGTERSWQAIYDALQLAGGSGYIATQPYEKRMRDARVATVFEGTSEIHSIYPPTFVARELGRELKDRGPFKRLGFIAGYWLASPRLPMAPAREPEIREALAATRRAIRGFRRLLLRGLIRYGSSIAKHEFLLRRITSLSLAAYSLVSAVVKIERERSSRGAASIAEAAERLRILRYLTVEARAAIAESLRFDDPPRERLTGTLFADAAAHEARSTGSPTLHPVLS